MSPMLSRYYQFVNMVAKIIFISSPYGRGHQRGAFGPRIRDSGWPWLILLSARCFGRASGVLLRERLRSGVDKGRRPKRHRDRCQRQGLSFQAQRAGLKYECMCGKIY